MSENIHPEFDGIFTRHASSSFARAAARGIKEEMSPRLRPRDIASEIILLGLEFHLQGYHPGLLFYAPLPYTRTEVERVCREELGKDFLEGSLRFVHLDDNDDIEAVLCRSDWYHAGKASVIRTLEFLSKLGEQKAQPIVRVAASLSQGNEIP